MQEECNHNCESCADNNCESRNKESLKISPHKLSHIKKTIGILSGKGGVGKSLVTSLLAVKKNREGNKVAILDADITGPSIPKMFGINGGLTSDGEAIYPAKSKNGIEIVSTNLILDNPEEPVIWRGPLLGSMVKQFYTDVIYGDIDYMFVDMPPGTSDVALTVMQSLNLDGLIIVTTPQDLVSMIVEKAIKMAKMTDTPILGIVENMSYLLCPHCKEKIDFFGKSHVEEVAKKYNLKVLGKIPLDSNITELVDAGKIELIKDTYLL